MQSGLKRYYYNTQEYSQMPTPPYLVKRTGFSVTLVPGLYKNLSIMQMLTCLSHKIAWYRCLIQQLDIIQKFSLVQKFAGLRPDSSEGILCSFYFRGTNP